jgi:hypothetical protein
MKEELILNINFVILKTQIDALKSVLNDDQKAQFNNEIEAKHAEILKKQKNDESDTKFNELLKQTLIR